jgi:hypothetical protein
MDRYLRRLKRQAEYDPNAKERYIAALERALGGNIEEEEHPYFSDAKVVSCWIKDRELENTILYHIERLGGYRISDESGNRMGYMIDLYWEENYDEEEIEHLTQLVGEEALQIFEEAKELGYTMMVFWR